MEYGRYEKSTYLSGNPKRTTHSGHLRVGEMMLLKCMLRKYSVTIWLGLIWLRMKIGGCQL
jgi:hypothetical protein